MKILNHKKTLIFLGALIALFWLLSLGTIPREEELTYGVSFSRFHTDELKLDWKETYLALLNDLGVRNFRFSAHWPLTEPKEGKYISIGCLEPHFWNNLCRLFGREDYGSFSPEDEPKKKEVTTFLENTFRTKSRDEWFALMKDKDIPVAPVYDLDEVFRDPQVIHRGVLIEMEHPKRGKSKHVGIPIRLSRTPGAVQSSAPMPGEHTRILLKELGYTEAQISGMAEHGAISIA